MTRLVAVTGHTRLARRGAVYYHRAAVPQDIRDSYPKAEETFSLKTKDRAEALRLVRLAAVEVDRRFDEHRRRISRERAEILDDLTPEQLAKAKAAYHRHLLEEDEDIRLDGFVELDEHGHVMHDQLKALGFLSLVADRQVARRYAVSANLIFKWLRDPRYAPDPA